METSSLAEVCLPSTLLGAECTVLFSGGQDSTIALLWALTQFDTVRTIGFNYGQLNDIELNARQVILESLPSSLARHPNSRMPALDTLVDVRSAFDGIRSGLLHPGSGVTAFVPGRNLQFIQMAAARAYVDESTPIHLVMGMSQYDEGHYPDCSERALSTLGYALALGLGAPVHLHAPVLNHSKGESWAWVKSTYGHRMVEFVRTQTHTCYTNDRHLHAWGFGCGHCPACKLRAAGWHEFKG